MAEARAPRPFDHHRIDDVVHQRTRLAILSALDECESTSTTFLRDLLRVTDGNLGQHLALLEEHGLVVRSKRSDGSSRASTWIALTPSGRDALQAEIKLLEELVERRQARVRGAASFVPLSET